MSDVKQYLKNVSSKFNFKGILQDHEGYGNGHINDTYLLTYVDGDTSNRYILQRINTNIFKKPQEVMENIEAVTSYLSDLIVKRGGDPKREALSIIKTREGELGYVDADGSYWRAYPFIENSMSIEMIENPEHFYKSGLAFGEFQAMLANFPADQLHFTIPNFHNTVSRFQAFKEAIENNKSVRAHLVEDEIQFVLDREAFASVLWDYHAEGKLPLKVTHNDTKINNVLFDRDSKETLCVIDLDTVMPGFSLDDFGDSIRSGATTGAEDEIDLSKVNFSIDLYKRFADGFIEGSNNTLSPLEIDLLPEGAKMMTFECGMRFLTDFLDGDLYFKTERDHHNLDRARTQFKLVSDMEEQWDELKDISRDFH